MQASLALAVALVFFAHGSHGLVQPSWEDSAVMIFGGFLEGSQLETVTDRYTFYQLQGLICRAVGTRSNKFESVQPSCSSGQNCSNNYTYVQNIVISSVVRSAALKEQKRTLYNDPQPSYRLSKKAFKKLYKIF